MCQNLQAKLEKDPELFSKTSIGDEIGLQYNPQTRQQFRLNSRKSTCPPPPQKGMTNSLKFQQHAHCFFDIQRVVHYEFAAQEQTVNQHYYMHTLQRPWEKCSENDMKIGIWGIIFSIMTMRPMTLLCLCVNFWLPTD
jgi:hypothetical protein